jgi:hypothetical protein
MTNVTSIDSLWGKRTPPFPLFFVFVIVCRDRKGEVCPGHDNPPKTLNKKMFASNPSAAETVPRLALAVEGTREMNS